MLVITGEDLVKSRSVLSRFGLHFFEGNRTLYQGLRYIERFVKSRFHSICFALGSATVRSTLTCGGMKKMVRCLRMDTLL